MADQSRPLKNVAFDLYFSIFKNDGTVISNPGGLAGRIVCESHTSGAATDNAPTVVDSTGGICKLTIAQAEMNGDYVAVKVTSTDVNAVAACFSIYPAAAAEPTVAQISDGVWDEAVAGHTTAGTFGKTDADELATVSDIHTDVGTAITNIGDVHATDLPAVKTVVDNLTSALAVVDGIADDIKALIGTANAAPYNTVFKMLGDPGDAAQIGPPFSGYSLLCNILWAGNAVNDVESPYATVDEQLKALIAALADVPAYVEAIKNIAYDRIRVCVEGGSDPAGTTSGPDRWPVKFVELFTAPVYLDSCAVANGSFTILNARAEGTMERHNDAFRGEYLIIDPPPNEFNDSAATSYAQFCTYMETLVGLGWQTWRVKVLAARPNGTPAVSARMLAWNDLVKAGDYASCLVDTTADENIGDNGRTNHPEMWEGSQHLSPEGSWYLARKLYEDFGDHVDYGGELRDDAIEDIKTVVDQNHSQLDAITELPPEGDHLVEMGGSA